VGSHAVSLGFGSDADLNVGIVVENLVKWAASARSVFTVFAGSQPRGTVRRAWTLLARRGRSWRQRV